MNRRDLNRRVRIERPVDDESWDGAGSGNWVKVGDAWAQVRDVLPSRSERQDDGVTTSARRSRIRTLFRTDINATMRFVMGSRTMQIVSGPAEMDGRQYVEFMVEEATPAGNGA